MDIVFANIQMTEDYYWTIDFGVNYASKRTNDKEVEDIIKNAYDFGVHKVVSISNSIREAHKNISLQKKFGEDFHYVIGCHPHEAKSFKDSDIAFLEKNVNNPNCFGIGECGLDFNRNFSAKDKQIDTFIKQVRVAKKVGKPLYIHCRDAFDEVKKILEDENYFNGFVHCFTGNLDQALYFTGKGLKLGITGFITDKRRNKDIVIALKDDRIKLEHLLIETDAPWMAIRPNKISKPEDTATIVQTIAGLKGISEIECGKQLYNNALDLLK